MAAIQEFAGKDARLFALAEVADIAGVKDAAAWLRRHGIARVQRMFQGKRLTLADPLEVLAAAKGVPVDSLTGREGMRAPYHAADGGWSPVSDLV